jgi:L-ornithine N5-oxygenase
MLLPGAKMQVSFVKDLATFRNPATRFSFLAYLHEMGRLPQFVNHSDFFPTRHEFHGYLEWAAAQVADQVSYSALVTGLHVPPSGLSGTIDHLDVDFDGHDGDRISARNIVLAVGLKPRMPEGVQIGPRAWHSSQFLQGIQALQSGAAERFVVVGAGQSAAEIVRYLWDHFPEARITSVLTPYGFSIADNTPFANQVFDPGAVDAFYLAQTPGRDAIWRYHRNTNYAVVDEEVARDLHQRVYDDSVAGRNRVDFLNLCKLRAVTETDGHVDVRVDSLATGEQTSIEADAVICATGYESMDTRHLLDAVEPYLLRDANGALRIGRDYRLMTTPELEAGIYLQGGTEHSHGITSSLLSNIAVRSGEIAQSIVQRCSARTADASRQQYAVHAP